MALVPFCVSGAAGRQDLEQRLMQVGPYSLLLQQRPRASGNTAHLGDGTSTRPDPSSSDASQQPGQQPDLSNVGLVLWQSGFVLADFLLLRLPAPGGAVCSSSSRCGSAQAGSGSWSGVRVLELGCGAGTVGMFLALAGAQVVPTDQQHILPLTEDNLQINFPATAAAAICSPQPAPSSSGTYGQRAVACQGPPGSTLEQQAAPPAATPASAGGVGAATGSQLQLGGSAPTQGQQLQSAAAAFAAAFVPASSQRDSSFAPAAELQPEQPPGQLQRLAARVFNAGPLVVQYSWGEPLQALQDRVAAGAAARLAGATAQHQQQQQASTTAASVQQGDAGGNEDGIHLTAANGDSTQRLQQLASEAFDVVVGADVLYDPRVHALLLSSLQQLAAASRHLQVFLSWRRRGLGEDGFLQEAAAAGWVVEEVPTGMLHPEFQSGDYRLARLVPLP